MRNHPLINKQLCLATHIVLTALTALGFVALLVAARDASAQKPSSLEIGQWRDILRIVKAELKENYYDPTFRGMDLDARFKVADEKMAKAESLGQLVGIAAQVLLDLNDSHTSFIPPYNSARVEYDWLMKPVGADCYVSAVRPGSNAAAKGLEAGDKVLSIDGRPLDRSKTWLAKYLYYILRPQRQMTVVVQKPDKKQRQITIEAIVREGKKLFTYGDITYNLILEAEKEDHLNRHRFNELSEDVLIWKMPDFDLGEDGVDNKVGKFRNRKGLILDLRGNPGGYVSALERLAGHFFSRDVKIADLKGRKQMKPMMAKGQNQKAFGGKLIVLLDGESKSASEVFARLMQIEKRGTVIGDRSAGSVMQSIVHRLEVGVINPLRFHINITDADLIMADGKSLEHVGVVPDELILPTPEDMAAGRDPALARAASLVGLKLDPDKAGELFPIEWRSR